MGQPWQVQGIVAMSVASSAGLATYVVTFAWSKGKERLAKRARKDAILERLADLTPRERYALRTLFGRGGGRTGTMMLSDGTMESLVKVGVLEIVGKIQDPGDRYPTVYEISKTARAHLKTHPHLIARRDDEPEGIPMR